MTTATALRLEDFSDVDTLSQPATIELLGSQLRDGMVLADELGCPVAGLDHKIGRSAQGATRWLIADLDKGGWSETSIGHAAKVLVVAR